MLCNQDRSHNDQYQCGRHKWHIRLLQYEISDVKKAKLVNLLLIKIVLGRSSRTSKIRSTKIKNVSKSHDLTGLQIPSVKSFSSNIIDFVSSVACKSLNWIRSTFEKSQTNPSTCQSLDLIGKTMYDSDWKISWSIVWTITGRYQSKWWDLLHIPFVTYSELVSIC